MDSDYREEDITALDTPTLLNVQGADALGNFSVPGDAQFLTEVRITVSPDWTADALLGFSSGVQLSGGGLEAKIGAFGGPCGTVSGAATLSGGIGIADGTVYHTAIKVTGGGTIEARGCMLGEDMGSLRMTVTLVYDGPAGLIKDADYREADLTAANALVALQARQGANNNDFQVIGPIGEIYLNGGLKPVAGPLACSTGFHFSGAGFLRSGNYKYTGPSFHTADDIALCGNSQVFSGIRYMTGGIPVRSQTNLVRCQAQEIEDDVGTIFSIATLCYY